MDRPEGVWVGVCHLLYRLPLRCLRLQKLDIADRRTSDLRKGPATLDALLVLTNELVHDASFSPSPCKVVCGMRPCVLRISTSGELPVRGVAWRVVAERERRRGDKARLVPREAGRRLGLRSLASVSAQGCNPRPRSSLTPCRFLLRN
jgi:hypothetical protein